MSERIVVLGASLAGWRVAESLRGNGFDGQLVLIGQEPFEPYDRPPLSKTVLTGRLGTDRLLLPRTRNLHAQWILGVAATGLDRWRWTVRLADGRDIGYDRLIIATGSRARQWPVPTEAALRGVHVLRGRDDADRLRADLIAAPRRVLVIGGGFTGSEVASSCLDQGIAVTPVQRAPAPLAGALGSMVGDVLGARRRAHGLELRVRTTVRALLDDGHQLAGAELSDGTRVDADVAVVALGSVRNTEWLADAGLCADSGGVDCDSACRAITLDGQVTDEVYVIGDVSPSPPARPRRGHR
jgi:NADPH-dependent 2,4-dienoyl-CoA reductase/sulfur reductase-like enzyme